MSASKVSAPPYGRLRPARTDANTSVWSERGSRESKTRKHSTGEPGLGEPDERRLQFPRSPYDTRLSRPDACSPSTTRSPLFHPPAPQTKTALLCRFLFGAIQG